MANSLLTVIPIGRPCRIGVTSPISRSFRLGRVQRVRNLPNVPALCSSKPRQRNPLRRQHLLDEVITSHLWLAEKLARQFRHRGVDDDDLVQVARTGLVEACLRFDPHRGSFVGFAEPTINGVLKRHFRDHGWTVRPPRPTQELAASIWRRWPSLVQEMGSLPCTQDLADELGAPVDAVQQARMASEGYSALSIDTAMSRGVCFSRVKATTTKIG